MIQFRENMPLKEIAERLRASGQEFTPAGRGESHTDGVAQFGRELQRAAEAIERHIRNQPVDVDAILSAMHQRCEVMVAAEVGHENAQRVRVQCARMITDWHNTNPTSQVKWHVAMSFDRHEGGISLMSWDFDTPDSAIEGFRVKILPTLAEYFAEATAPA